MLWIYLAIGFVVLFVVSMLVQAYRYTINYKSIYFPDFPFEFDGLNILFISDIHRRKVSNRLLKYVQEHNAIDYVFIGGDLVEAGVPIDRLRENIRLIRALGPTYFVWGNHDLKYDVHRLTFLLNSEGILILDNESTLLRKENKHNLWLIGIGDVCSKKDRLDLALQGIADEELGFRILLSHVPTITRKIKQEQNIALVLSGHTHGGQISFPWIGPITGAVGQLFPKQVVGYHDLGYTKLFISSGYGTSHFPLRLFTTPEIAILTLRRGNRSKKSSLESLPQ